jgi:hypothetical protein
MYLTMTSFAYAALGGDVASVVRDHQALRVTHAVTSLTNYEIHEGQSPGGLHLREFVDHSGKVFAVSWQSPGNANVNTLLGAYAARYQAAARSRRGGHHMLYISAPDLTLSIMRLPRGWRGLAILPNAIPDGVSRAEIQ